MRFLKSSLACVLTLAATLPLRGEDTLPAVSFHAVLDRIGINYSGEAAYKIDKNYPRGDWNSDRTAFWTVLASSGAVVLRLESSSHLSPDAAVRDIDLKFARIKMLYSGNMAYPGLLTQTFKVPEQLMPEEIESSPSGKLWLLYSTKNLTYGAGAEDLIFYRAAIAAVYCRDTGVLSYLELFWPKRLFDRPGGLAEIRRFTCAPAIGVKH